MQKRKGFEKELKSNVGIQLIALFVILFFLFTFGLGLFIYQNWKKSYTEIEFSHLKSEGETQKLWLQQWLNNRRDEMRFLANTDYAKRLDFVNMEILLHGMVLSASVYDTIYLFDTSGQTLLGVLYEKEKKTISSQQAPNIQVADREWFKNVMSGNETFVEPVVSRATGNQVITVAVPVYNAQGKIIAAIRGAILLDSIFDRAAEMDTGEGVEIFLLDDTGHLIERGDNGPSQGQALKTEAALAIISKTSGTDIYTGKRDRTVIGSYTHLPVSNWGLVIEKDYAKAMAPFESTWQIILMSVILSSILILIVAPFLIIQTVTSPLKKVNVELEQRVAIRTAQLEAKNQELNSFAYSVSHDLKAPLRGIDGYSRLLLEDHQDNLNEEGRTFLLNIRHSADRMNQLISDLLAYSRLEQRTFQKTPVNLHALAQALVEEAYEEIQKKNATVSVELHGLAALSDNDGLTIALRNLLDNALKFSDISRPPQITISGEEKEQSILLSVSDNGIGFDMKYHDRIFGIFNRLHRLEDYPGTGIGLAIVRKAIERMGGRVWAQSEEGKGATFFLEIPKQNSGDTQAKEQL